MWALNMRQIYFEYDKETVLVLLHESKGHWNTETFLCVIVFKFLWHSSLRNETSPFSALLSFTRSCQSDTSSSIFPCPLHVLLSHQLSAYPLSPHPLIYSLVFFFASCLLPPAPSLASFYQYIHISSSEYVQIISIGLTTNNLCCPSDVLVPNPVLPHHSQRESQHL